MQELRRERHNDRRSLSGFPRLDLRNLTCLRLSIGLILTCIAAFHELGPLGSFRAASLLCKSKPRPADFERAGVASSKRVVGIGSPNDKRRLSLASPQVIHGVYSSITSARLRSRMRTLGYCSTAARRSDANRSRASPEPRRPPHGPGYPQPYHIRKTQAGRPAQDGSHLCRCAGSFVGVTKLTRESVAPQ